MTQQTESAAKDEGGMSLWDHIGELRKRIIYSLIVFGIGLVGGLFAAEPLYDYLVAAAPTEKLELHAFSPWDAIGLYMKFAVLISFIIAIPFAFYQLWAFVRPGLSPKERSATVRYIPGAFIMFLAGLAFAYFVVFPLAFKFTERVTANMGLEQTYGLAQYFSFLFNLLIPISLLFELPLLIMFLTRIGIVNPRLLRKMRRLAWFIMVAVGVMITPPDVISDLLVALPLILLYEFSVLLAQSAHNKRMAAKAAREAEFEEIE
jgi:sec-independent protein translocase protein TatC